MLQIAVAMNYLHESGVMYSDLKATNVLVNVLEDHDGYLVIGASCTSRPLPVEI
jgi:serine/threonine protein kinase